MKTYLTLVVFTALVASIALAFPASNNSEIHSDMASNSTANHTEVKNNTLVRHKRDMSGIFDAIANGAESFTASLKGVGDSIQKAFDGIFSKENGNAIASGFDKFKTSITGAFSNIFGDGGSKVKDGFKKIGDKVKGVFNGKGKDKTKDAPPSGEVPTEETT